MGLILHRGAELVSYDALRSVITPPPTDTHVPIPHHELVELVRSRWDFTGTIS